jgi:LuxR family transcriptional regulator, maltose regulon positive regulatory protein
MAKKSKPLVKLGVFVTGEETDQFPIQVGSPDWHAWLTNHEGFLYEGSSGHFSARSELRRGIRYWYAYRRREGKLSKTYLGKPDELNLERLEQASAILAGLAPNGPNGMSSPQAPENGLSAAAVPEIPYPPLTKYKPPALLQKLVARSRLTQRIHGPATLISAPSGFGKTTLLNSWRQTCGMQVAWVTLDAGDNHPQQFWSSVTQALQIIHPGIGEGWLSQLGSFSPPSLLNTITNLTNDVVRLTEENHAPGICLVLDDFQQIRQTEILSSLQTWLEQIPPKFHLVIASNFKLPLALGFLRAKGTVTELKADDLRFTFEEGVDLLKLHIAGEPLASSDMQTLVRRTEGWAAGLVLAGSVLSQEENRSRAMELFTGAHEYLREFFMESVLRQQCPEVRDFLIKTSILEHLTGPLCDAITGRRDGAEMLDRLWEESLFLERLEEPGWYRYHEMFAEMLRAQLKEQFPAEIPLLHHSAAWWFRARGSPAEAVRHLLLCEAWDEAADLIEVLALSELDRLGEDSRLLRWLQQLPEPVVQQRQTLLVVYIRLARMGLPPKEVDDFLSRTEAQVAAMPASEKTSALQETLTEILGIRYLWTDGGAAGGLRATREDDAVGQMLDGILQIHRDSRVDLVKAEAEASQVYETALAKSHLYSILTAGGALANLELSQGHLRRSEQIAYQVLRLAGEMRDKLPEPASSALTALSGVAFERNQMAQAQQLLERAVAVDPHPINPNGAISMAILRAKMQSIQGEHETAFATLQEVRETYSRNPSNIWLEQDLIAYQALFLLHQGDIIAAERHLGGGWEIDLHPFSAFVRASILFDQGRDVAAGEILSHLLERYPYSSYWMPILRARVKLSTVQLRQQKINQARQTILEAARMAAPEFFIRPFLSTGPVIASLLSLILRTEDLNLGTRSFIKGILSMEGYTDEISSRDEPAPLEIAASISPREQEILQSLSIGLSNQEIAIKYSISASTVKTHLENIFRKLGVNNRTQAIAQAQALNLV